jgi:hypothetical protein
VDSGLAPLTDGWFVVNVRDAAWLTNDAFGARCVFEANRPVLRRRPDVETQTFRDLGLTLDVIWPGQPSGRYHAAKKGGGAVAQAPGQLNQAGSGPFLRGFSTRPSKEARVDWLGLGNSSAPGFGSSDDFRDLDAELRKQLVNG